MCKIICVLNSVLFLLLLTILSACSSSGRFSATKAADLYKDEGYVLAWSDEFDVDGKPSSENWIFSEGFRRNKEHQWYSEDNATCRDGILTIKAERIEPKPSPWYDPDSDSWKKQRKYIEYTSSCMVTKKLNSWKFGRFEARCKIDPRLGSWPAFWTVGVDGSWPSNGEIDILEYYKGKLLANVFWGGRDGRRLSIDSKTKQISEFEDGWADQFHVYRMDWDEDFIRLYVDDLLLNEVDLSKTTNQDLTKGPENPLHQPHFILLNLAIGGTCGGDPSQTEFPVTLEVDYVRVYSRQ